MSDDFRNVYEDGVDGVSEAAVAPWRIDLLEAASVAGRAAPGAEQA